jgi:pimeloyl-ACP methyl ester carboxylesterase
MASPERIPPSDARDLVNSYLASAGYAAANDEMRRSVFDDEGRIDVPVAIAWGEADRLVGPPSSSRVPPGATLTSMPGWGHTPMWDDPDGVVRFLLAASSIRR